MNNNYKQFAIDLAEKAGKVMLENFQLAGPVDFKSGYSPVTKADTEINRMVIEKVSEFFPTHGVLGEEESNRKEEEKYVWVCDPIDGTIPYSHGIPISTFSLALVEDGKPILGVVYDPFMKRMYFAEKGKGATLNGRPIHVSKSTDFEKDVIAYEAYSRAKYDLHPTIKYLSELNVKNVIFNSIIYGGMMVALGEFLAAIFPGVHAHDAATMKIIVEEAGGKVTDLFGDEQRYDQETNGVIVSNELIHKQLVEIVGKTIIKR